MFKTTQMLIACSALALPAALQAQVHTQIQSQSHASAGAQTPHIVGSLPATLSSAVSSSSARVGQPLLAKLSSPASLSDGSSLPAGSQLLGHISQVKSFNPQTGTSSLGMVFDRVKTAAGQEKQISGVLQGIGKARAATQQAAPASGSEGGGLLGGVTGAVGGTVSGVTNTAGSLLGTVTGLPGVLLDSAGNLNAKGRNIEIASGTSISVQSSASAGASSGDR